MRVFLAICLLLSFNKLFAINGGANTTIEKFPWQVDIFYVNSTIGGGTILSPNLIISAKHVFTNRNLDEITIVAGATKQEDFKEHQRTIHRIIVHEYMDVVLIELSEPLIFRESIQAVDYESSSDSNYYALNTKAVASGWGIQQSSLAKTLQEVELKIISPEEARLINKLPESVIQPYELPTLRYEQGVGGICNGDSGGPLVTWSEKLGHYVFLGVANWSLGAGCPTDPQHISVFTKASYLIDWINKHQIQVVGPEDISSIGEVYHIKNKPLDSYIDWEYSSTLQKVKNIGDSVVFMNSGDAYATGSIQGVLQLGTRKMKLPPMDVTIAPKVDVLIQMEEDRNKEGILSGEVVNYTGFYYWEYEKHYAYTGTLPHVKFNLLNQGINTLKVRIYDGKRWVLLEKTFEIEYNQIDSVYLTPNPANNFMNISLSKKEYTSTIKDMHLDVQKNIIAPRDIPPRSDLLYISSKNKTMSVLIYNEFGRLMKRLDYPKLVDNTLIEINDLLPGLYILNVQEDGTKIVSRRFVVMH